MEWAQDWAFRMAGLHRLGLEVYKLNQTVQKMWETLGFVAEAREGEFSW